MRHIVNLAVRIRSHFHEGAEDPAGRSADWTYVTYEENGEIMIRVKSALHTGNFYNGPAAEFEECWFKDESGRVLSFGGPVGPKWLR